jgi:DNA-binding winged helix-turn-helix (wHTH) protein/Tfp pilus assembly protein PilF
MNVPARESYYEFGLFRLKPALRMLEYAGAEVHLKRQLYDILLILVRCRKRIVTSKELIEAIWPSEKVKRSANLWVDIAELRKKLKSADPAASGLIKSHPMQGYSFAATVHQHGLPMTVVILPFKVEERQQAPDESGLKLADRLTGMLSSNGALSVRRQDTVMMEYNQHSDQSPQSFGHRLTADHVFSGNIRREQELIDVEFRDVRAGEVRDIVSFEGCRHESDEASKSIHAWMKSVLGLPQTHQGTKQLATWYTAKRKAKELYEDGRVQRFRGTAASLRRATTYFERAVEEDSNFAQAYVGIAGTYIYRGMMGLISPQESYDGSREAAIKARAIDDNLVGAHSTWAFVKLFFERQWEEAQSGFERAIEIKSDYPAAHMGYAHCLTAQRLHAKAEAEIDLALQYDPFSFFLSFVRGMVLFLARKCDESLKQFEQTQLLSLNFNLKSDLPHYGISLAYEYRALTGAADEREGLFKKADDEAHLAVRFSKRHPLKLLHHAQLKAMCGKRDEAMRLLDEALDLRRRGFYVSPYHLGIVYASLGETDLAIESLEAAPGERDQYLFLMGVDPRLDSLRSDPGFKDLLQRLGL